MQELIWYIECYGPWVAGGFVVGVWFALWRSDAVWEKEHGGGLDL